jgi:DNA-directed RNA polymerase
MSRDESVHDLLGVPLEAIELERRMASLGAARARRQIEKAILRGNRTATPAGAGLLSRSIPMFAKAIHAWRRKAAKSGAHSSLPLIESIPDLALAAVTGRTVFDQVTGRTPLVYCAHAVGAAVEYEAKCRALSAASKGSLWKDLRGTLRRKRGKYKRRQIVRRVAAQLAAETPEWPRRERIRVGVLLIELLRQSTGLVDVQNIRGTGKKGRPRAFVMPTQAAVDALASRDARGELLPVYLPMRHPPRDWTTARDGGYLSNTLLRKPLVKGRTDGQVAAVDAARPTAVYRAVNTLQRVPWRVNRRVLEVARALLEQRAAVVVSEAPGVYPARPEGETDRQSPEWKAYLRAASDWKRARDTHHGRAMQAARTVQLAGEYERKPFYLPMQVDFRGRVYPVPSFLNPQGDDLARGILEFDEGKPVRDREQLQALHTHGANAWGHDKLPFRERSAWVAANAGRIRQSAADPLGCNWWREAESPWQFLAFCLSFADREADQGAELHIPCYFDCSNSGLQLFSMLARDPVGARYTNCVPTDAPEDIYREVARDATAILRASSAPEAAQWLEFLDGEVPRKFAKRPTMVLPYSATFHAVIKYVRAEYEAVRVAKGWTPFPTLDGGGYRASAFLGRIIWDAIGRRLGPAQELMAWLRGAADVCSAHDLPVKWSAPSGFPVVQWYPKWKSRRIVTSLEGTVRWTRYREDQDDQLNAGKQADGVVPNFVHSIDAAILVRAVNRCRENGIKNLATIHDSFACLPTDAPAMLRALRGCVADTMRTDWVGRFKADLERYLPEGVSLPDPPPSGSWNPDEVRDATYWAS